METGHDQSFHIARHGEIAVVTVCYALGPMVIARRLRGLPVVGVIATSLALTALAYAPVGVLQLPNHALSLKVMLVEVALTSVPLCWLPSVMVNVSVADRPAQSRNIQASGCCRNIR